MKRLLVLLTLLFTFAQCAPAQSVSNWKTRSGMFLPYSPATDFTNSLTLRIAVSSDGPHIWTIDPSTEVSGYVLTADGLGGISWQPSSASPIGAVLYAPPNATTQVIQGTANGFVPFAIKARSLATDNLTEWQNSSGTPRAYIDYFGDGIFSQIQSYDGFVEIGGNGMSTGALQIDDGISHGVQIATAVPTTDWSLTLPADGGTAGYVPVTDGIGTLSWVNPATFGGVTSVSDNGGSTLTISPTTGSVLAGINLAHANIWTALQTGNANGIATTSTYRLALTNTTASTVPVPNQQSPSLEIISHGYNSGDITNTWNIYSAGGANASGNRENISFELDQGSGFAAEAKIYYDGAISARTRFLLNGATPTAGHFLRSDGTGYLDGTIQAGDLPSLSGSYIQNQTSSQSSASFNITNNVATTAQVASTYTAGTATALTLTANTSNSGHANQGLTFDVSNASGTANDIIGTSTNWKVTSAGDATFNSATLSTPLTVANGGIGAATLAAHDVLVGNGASAITPVSPSTAGFVLTSAGTGTDPSFQAIPTVLTMLGAYGDASDGDVSFNASAVFSFATLSGSTYTLNRSVYAHNITTSSSAIVKTNGFAIFATGTVTNGSGCTIHCNGISATVGLGGGGAASNTAATTMFPPGLAGKNGPSTISAGVNGATITVSYGGSGGAGGADGAGHAGGTAGTATAPGAQLGSVHAFPMQYFGGAFNNSGLSFWQPGGGGASGGNSTNGVSISGNGGGGAGILAIYAQAISNSGTISANGGNGSTSAQTASATGGGGGGGGGFVLLVTNSFSGTTPTVTGGTKGNGTSGGSAGSDGNAGTYTLILNQ